MIDHQHTRVSNAIALLRSGGSFADAMQLSSLSFEDVIAAWVGAQQQQNQSISGTSQRPPQAPQQPIKPGALPVIALALTKAAQYAYAATWVDDGARQHLIAMMLDKLSIVQGLAVAPPADDTRDGA